MSSKSTAAVPFTIDAILTGMLAFPDSPDLYRIRIQPQHATLGGPTIKYLTAPNSSKSLTGPDAHIRRHNRLAFKTVPAGDWIVAHLAATASQGNDNSDDKLEVASTSPTTTDALNALGLRTAEPIWHPLTIPEAACQQPTTTPHYTTTVITPSDTSAEITPPKPRDLQCMDYPSSASIIPTPQGSSSITTAPSVVCITDWLPGHHASIASDSRAHQLIAAHDPGLAPRFLGHVAENGGLRVIGFLLERVGGDGDDDDVREAGAGDLEGCRAALARLHALGVVKAGGLRRHSFLVRGGGGGGVLIQGPFFAGAVEGEGPEDGEGVIMRREMESLEGVLAMSPSEFEDQAARMRRLVDPERVKVLGEFEKAHGFVVPFVYREEGRVGGGRITLTPE